ncbi:MAG: MFS transporter [Promicromonosporaceae bacterium]|nr:MFS transporter [Promicromonosporaceae bacterium]
MSQVDSLMPSTEEIGGTAPQFNSSGISDAQTQSPKGIYAKTATGLLAVILLSYIVVGFPDGAFTVSWLGMAADDPTMTTAHTGIILLGYSATYTLAGILLGRLNQRLKLQMLYFIGLMIMATGFIALALSPTFVWKVISIAIYGLGTGLMAASMNSYMAKHFTAKHNNWMHFFWGVGAAISPLIMGQAMDAFGWREGYFIITGILVVVMVVLAWSMGRKMWLEDADDAISGPTATAARPYLTRRRHQVIEVMTFFFLGGTDYTIVFFTGAALIARGHYPGDVFIYSTVYYAFMTIGRLVAGSITRWFHENTIIRATIGITLIGIGVLYLTGSVIGMAITGLGLAPLLPTLVSDSSHRFAPAILPKVVGWELAAFGAGIAALFFLTSQILHFISYEALFPLAAFFAIAVFVCNEILEREMRRHGILREEETTPVARPEKRFVTS